MSSRGQPVQHTVYCAYSFKVFSATTDKARVKQTVKMVKWSDPNLRRLLMLAVNQSAQQSPDLQHFFKAHTDAQTSKAGQLQAQARAKADLTIVTAEGDRVSFSAKSALQAIYTTYDARGRLQGPPNVHSEALQVKAQNSLAVEVEGDLNAEELADIERLLGHLKDVAMDFFSGDLDEALLGGLDIDELDSIASFGASLRLKQRVSVTQFVAAQQIAGNTPNTQPSRGPSVDHVINQMLQAVRDAKLATAELTDRLPGFVSELFEKLADDLDFDTPKRQLAAHITSTFSQRLQLTAALSASGAEAADPMPTADVEAKPSQDVTPPLVAGNPEADAASEAVTADVKSHPTKPSEVAETPPASSSEAADPIRTTDVKANASQDVTPPPPAETPEAEDVSSSVITAEFKATFSQRFRLSRVIDDGHAGAVRYQVDSLLATRLYQQFNIA
jgi:hypothetical protein